MAEPDSKTVNIDLKLDEAILQRIRSGEIKYKDLEPLLSQSMNMALSGKTEAEIRSAIYGACVASDPDYSVQQALNDVAKDKAIPPAQKPAARANIYVGSVESSKVGLDRAVQMIRSDSGMPKHVADAAERDARTVNNIVNNTTNNNTTNNYYGTTPGSSSTGGGSSSGGTGTGGTGNMSNNNPGNTGGQQNTGNNSVPGSRNISNTGNTLVDDFRNKKVGSTFTDTLTKIYKSDISLQEKQAQAIFIIDIALMDKEITAEQHGLFIANIGIIGSGAGGFSIEDSIRSLGITGKSAKPGEVPPVPINTNNNPFKLAINPLGAASGGGIVEVTGPGVYPQTPSNGTTATSTTNTGNQLVDNLLNKKATLAETITTINGSGAIANKKAAIEYVVDVAGKNSIIPSNIHSVYKSNLPALAGENGYNPVDVLRTLNSGDPGPMPPAGINTSNNPFKLTNNPLAAPSASIDPYGGPDDININPGTPRPSNLTPGDTLQTTGNSAYTVGDGPAVTSASGQKYIGGLPVPTGPTTNNYQRNIHDSGVEAQYPGRSFSDGIADIVGGVTDQPSGLIPFENWQPHLYPWGVPNYGATPPTSVGGIWGGEGAKANVGLTPQDTVNILWHTPISSGSGIQTNPDGSYQYFGDYAQIAQFAASQFAPVGSDLYKRILADLENPAAINSPYGAVGDTWFDNFNTDQHGLGANSSYGDFKGTPSIAQGSGKGAAGLAVYAMGGQSLPKRLTDQDPRLLSIPQLQPGFYSGTGVGAGGNTVGIGGPGGGGGGNLGTILPDNSVPTSQPNGPWNPPIDRNAPYYSFQFYDPDTGRLTTSDLWQDKHGGAITYSIPRQDGKAPTANDMASTEMALLHNYVFKDQGHNLSDIGNSAVAQLIMLRAQSIRDQKVDSVSSAIIPGGVGSSVQNTPSLLQLEKAIQLWGTDRIWQALSSDRFSQVDRDALRAAVYTQGTGPYGAITDAGWMVQGDQEYGFWDPSKPNIPPNAAEIVRQQAERDRAAGFGTFVPVMPIGQGGVSTQVNNTNPIGTGPGTNLVGGGTQGGVTTQPVGGTTHTHEGGAGHTHEDGSTEGSSAVPKPKPDDRVHPADKLVYKNAVRYTSGYGSTPTTSLNGNREASTGGGLNSQMRAAIPNFTPVVEVESAARTGSTAGRHPSDTPENRAMAESITNRLPVKHQEVAQQRNPEVYGASTTPPTAKLSATIPSSTLPTPPAPKFTAPVTSHVAPQQAPDTSTLSQSNPDELMDYISKQYRENQQAAARHTSGYGSTPTTSPTVPTFKSPAVTTTPPPSFGTTEVSAFDGQRGTRSAVTVTARPASDAMNSMGGSSSSIDKPSFKLGGGGSSSKF